MFDCHIHTKFSTDSQMDIEDAAKRASELNLGLIITEHVDLKYPMNGKFIFNPGEYFKEYSKYRDDNLLLGLEMGMREDCVEENKRFASGYAFDYIIGSIHVVDDIDLFETAVYEGKSKKEVYSNYLNTMLQCIKKHDFVDCLGHIDYICRYAKYEDNEMHYRDFIEEIDEILRELIKTGRAIEINTRRLMESEVVNNLIPIYKRYHELGGVIVTVGSDSHRLNNIGHGFDAAGEIAERCGLKMVYYKERKLYYV